MSNYPKGTKKLVEIEFFEDSTDEDLLNSIYQGTPLKGNTYKVNIVYLQTIEQIKEAIKGCVIESLDKL